MSEAAPTIEISPRRVLGSLLGIIALLVAGHALVTLAEFGFGRDHVFGLRDFLDFNGEGNPPAWFSSFLLLLCAALLAAIGAAGRVADRRFHGHWTGLAAVFLFLAIDEAVALHEKLIDPVRDALGTGGALLHAWIIPYGIALALLLIAYRPFLMALSPRSRGLMLGAGMLYLGGAVGIEMIGGAVWDANPERGVFIVGIMAVEETLEMAGLALFAYTLLDHLSREYPLVRVRVARVDT